MPAPAKPFGRRNLPSPSPSAPPVTAAASPAPTEAERPETTGEVSDALSGLTAALAEERQKAEQDKRNGLLIVPASGRAAFLAGLVVACLHASLDLGTSVALGQKLGTLPIGGRTLPIVPLILLGSLWSGARSSAIGLFFVRALLGRMQVTNITAYALCGGFLAFLYALIAQALGWGDLEALPIDVATGLAAGFLYRLFAGTRVA